MTARTCPFLRSFIAADCTQMTASRAVVITRAMNTPLL